MKVKHNKKRNTAVVYETLLKDMTAAILKGDSARKQAIVSILKEHFSIGTTLNKDLSCYRSLYETKEMPQETAQRIVFEAKKQRASLDPKDLFNAQTRVIHDINKTVDPSIFSNFVPNYKTLATIHQIFSDNLSPKERVLLENNIVDLMCEKNVLEKTGGIDNITLNTFIRKFNERYEDKLIKEQKELLSHYIASFADNSLSLKVYLNEEVSRLKTALSDNLEDPMLQEDTDMLLKTKKVIDKMNSLKEASINDDTLTIILRTQAIVKEFQADAAND